MDEAQWLACEDTLEMVEFLTRRISERKFRGVVLASRSEQFEPYHLRHQVYEVFVRQ